MTTQDATYLVSEILLNFAAQEDSDARLKRLCQEIRRDFSDNFPAPEIAPTGYHQGVFNDSTINLTFQGPRGPQTFVVTIRHKV